MRNVTELFRQTLYERRNFKYTVKLTLTNGEEFNLTDEDFTVDGCSLFEDCGSSSFPLGGVISKYVELNLTNLDGRWERYDFFGATVDITLTLPLLDETSESLVLGRFTVVEPEDYGTTVTIRAIDNLYKADKVYVYEGPTTETVNINWLFEDVVTYCGLVPATSPLPSIQYEVKLPEKDKTCRQILSWIAMICAGICRCDEYGYVKVIQFYQPASNNEISGGYHGENQDTNYDGKTFEDYSVDEIIEGGDFNQSTGFSDHLFNRPYSLTVSTDDIIITGVKTVVDDVTYMSGSDGYVLVVDNPLFSNIQTAIDLIGDRVVGLRFRKFELSNYGYPIAEVGDDCTIESRLGNSYISLITDIEFKFRGGTTIKCSADDPIRHSSERPGTDNIKVEQLRQDLNKEISEREAADEALTHQIEAVGGFYVTEIEDPETHALIVYMHNKPTLLESNIQWKITSETMSVSTDFGGTWNAALNASGIAILQRIYANGIILGGSSSSAGYDGYLKCQDADGNDLVVLDKNGITLGPTQKIAFNNVAGQNNSKSIIDYYDFSVNKQKWHKDYAWTPASKVLKICEIADASTKDYYMSNAKSVILSGLNAIDYTTDSEGNYLYFSMEAENKEGVNDAIKFRTNNAGTWLFTSQLFLYNGIRPEQNSVVTISFDIKSSVTSSNSIHMPTNYNTSTKRFDNKYYTFTSTPEWSRVVWHTTIDASASEIEESTNSQLFKRSLFGWSLGQATDYTISHIQVDYGNTEGIWKPEGYSETLDESITKITENTITTEYLNSKHIDCSSLSGNVISGKYIEIRGRVEVKTDSMTTTMIALQPSKLDAFTSLGGLLVSQSSHPWCYPSGAFSYPYEGDIYDSIKLATNVEVHLIRPNYISCRYAMDTTDLHVTRNLQVNYCSTNTLHIQNFNSEPTKIGSSHAGGVNLYCDGFDLYIIKSDTNISQIEYTDAYASNFREMSSKLLKTNISEITDDDAKAFLQLSPVEFDFVEQFGGEHSVGILAEDLLELIPNCPAVHIPKNYDSTKKLKDIDFTSMDDIGSLLSVDYSNLVPYLMKVNQMQQKEIEALKSEIAEIKSMLVSLTN